MRCLEEATMIVHVVFLKLLTVLLVEVTTEQEALSHSHGREHLFSHCKRTRAKHGCSSAMTRQLKHINETAVLIMIHHLVPVYVKSIAKQARGSYAYKDSQGDQDTVSLPHLDVQNLI